MLDTSRIKGDGQGDRKFAPNFSPIRVLSTCSNWLSDARRPRASTGSAPRISQDMSATPTVSAQHIWRR